MNVILSIALFLGLTVPVGVLLAVLRRWTASKQRQLSAEEFRRWFQKTYLGMNPVAQASPKDSPARREEGLRPQGSSVVR